MTHCSPNHHSFRVFSNSYSIDILWHRDNKVEHLTRCEFLCLVPFLHLPDFIAKKPAGSGISVLCRCCCDSSSSVSAPHNRRKSGLRGFSQAGCQWPAAASPPPPDPPQEEQPPPADPAPAAAAHIPAASTQRTLLGLGCSPPAGGRGPAGRPSWLELSIEPAQRPPSLHTPTPLQRPGHNGSTHRLLRQQAVATRRFK